MSVSESAIKESLAKLIALGDELAKFEELAGDANQTGGSFEDKLDLFITQSGAVLDQLEDPLHGENEVLFRRFVQVHARVAAVASNVKSGIAVRLAALERNRPGLIKYWVQRR